MSERVLPAGWTLASIDQISIKGEQRKPDAAEQFIYVDIGSIDRESKVIVSPQRLSGSAAPSRARKVIRAGDVLVSLTRPNLNAVALVGQEYDGQIASTGFEVIRPVGVDSRFLLSLVKSKSFIDAISGKVQGALYPAAKSHDVKCYQFALPPAEEQKAIADKLDEVLAQVNNLKARLEAIPAILKRFRKSVLSAAVNGKLTRDFSCDDGGYYRELENVISLDRKLSKIAPVSEEEAELSLSLHGDAAWDGWKLFPLSHLVVSSRGIPYGIVQTGSHIEEGVPVIRCGDVQELTISSGELKKVSVDISNGYKRTLLYGGEVVLAIRGSVGNAAVVPEDMKGNNISREVALIPVIDNVNSQYIAIALQSPGGYRCLAEKVKGVAQKGINLSDVRRFVTPLPPLQEQSEIVHRVEKLFAFADQIERQVENAQTRVNKLTQSILAKAFRGELTAEWRAEHPELISGEHSAEALLARIKAEKAKHKPAGKRRGGRTAMAAT